PLPPEGERSYVGNALAKARSAALLAGAVALADDSGLEIDALGGLPGVRSARFGGEHLTDAERCALVLARMRGVAPGRRTARFRCVIALADPTGREDTAEGTVEGEIAEAARGTGGFGYDPIFVYPPLARTFAEGRCGPRHEQGHSRRGRVHGGRARRSPRARVHVPGGHQAGRRADRQGRARQDDAGIGGAPRGRPQARRGSAGAPRERQVEE